MRVELGGGRLGLLAPDPRQRAFGSLDSHSGGSLLGGGPARGGRAGLAGVTPRKGRGATRLCGAPPIRRGFRRDTFPSGEGGGLRELGRGSPTVAPLRVGVARSALVEGGGDLLRRPTEAALAPLAMGRCGRLHLLGLVSCRDGWDSSPQTLARGPHGPLDSRSGISDRVGSPARGGRAGRAGVTARDRRAATQNLRGSPYPSRQLP